MAVLVTLQSRIFAIKHHIFSAIIANREHHPDPTRFSQSIFSFQLDEWPAFLFSVFSRGRSEASQVDFLNSFARGDRVFLGLLNPRLVHWEAMPTRLGFGIKYQHSMGEIVLQRRTIYNRSWMKPACLLRQAHPKLKRVELKENRCFHEELDIMDVIS